MNPHIFREFSIRGTAATELPHDVVFSIGQAIATFFARQNRSLLVVGRDVRPSSPRISESLIKGLLHAGADIIDIDIVPTPVLNFAVDFFRADGGIMITASHNPSSHNGFKIRSDRTLFGEDLRAIYRLTQAENASNRLAKLFSKDAITPYLTILQQRLVDGRKLRIVVDGGNGTNGPIVTRLLRQHGHEVITLFDEPDGTFPNRSPDPTAVGALDRTAQMVRDIQADCGFAYDGDGDRLVFIDDKGVIHFGDIVLMLLARQMAVQGSLKVVSDVSSSQALADDVLSHGGEYYQAPVGYAFVHDKMLKVGAALGGEAAGHIFCLDEQFRFDDAILATVMLLNLVVHRDALPSELIADLPRYATSPNYRLFCPDDVKSDVVLKLLRKYESSHQVDTTDGVKIIFPRGWALIRQSNTQPALTYRVEGVTPNDLKKLEAEVSVALREVLHACGVQPDKQFGPNPH